MRDDILVGADNTPMWKTASDEAPAQVQSALAELRQKQEEERQRLLYVAMTRAEQWLIVCAAGELGKGDSWYQKIEAGLTHAGAVTHDFGFGEGLRFQHGSFDGEASIAQGARGTRPALPTWADQHLPTPDRPEPAITPSALGGAKALGGPEAELDEEAAKARGTLLHLLLEHLPPVAPDQRPDVARRILSSAAPDLAEAAALDLLTEAACVLDAPHLAHLFAPDALAEVELTALLPQAPGRRLHGTIDRLIVSNDHVLVVDFKSNAVVPNDPQATPEGILRQMGAYADAVAQIYPDRSIQTAILWTRTAQLMPLPAALTSAALGRATPS